MNKTLGILAANGYLPQALTLYDCSLCPSVYYYYFFFSQIHTEQKEPNTLFPMSYVIIKWASALLIDDAIGVTNISPLVKRPFFFLWFYKTLSKSWMYVRTTTNHSEESYHVFNVWQQCWLGFGAITYLHSSFGVIILGTPYGIIGIYK